MIKNGNLSSSRRGEGGEEWSAGASAALVLYAARLPRLVVKTDQEFSQRRPGRVLDIGKDLDRPILDVRGEYDKLECAIIRSDRPSK